MPVEDSAWPEGLPAEQFPPPESVTDQPHPGPPVSTPGPVPEPHPGDVEDVTAQEEVPEFDERYREDFEGLLYLGRLTDTFTWLGHDFVIRTLSTGEVLEVGLLQRPYRESLADVKAYQAAIVAACVVTVDGKPLPTPLTSEASDTALVNRFQYVLKSWFPPVLDHIYERYLHLEARVDRVLAAMGNPSR